MFVRKIPTPALIRRTTFYYGSSKNYKEDNSNLLSFFSFRVFDVTNNAETSDSQQS